MSRGGRGGRGGRPLSFIVQTYKTLLRDSPLQRPSVGDEEIFPPLLSKVAPPHISKQMEYMLAVKKDLESRFQTQADIEAENPKDDSLQTFFPPELFAAIKKKRIAPTVVPASDSEPAPKKRKTDDLDPESDLAESADASGAIVHDKPAEKTSEKGSDDEEEVDDGEEEVLEDNDYIDTYFDNGEGYGVDEEDDLDGENWYY